MKCNICNEVCSRSSAPVHLYKLHNITDQKVISQWNNDNNLIWQYFSKKDLFTAECKFCGSLLTVHHNSILRKHLKSQFHSAKVAAIREEITRIWVSSHFTFDMDNCNTNCIHCDYSVKISDGVDVLKNHLNENHNIDEYFVDRKKGEKV